MAKGGASRKTVKAEGHPEELEAVAAQILVNIRHREFMRAKLATIEAATTLVAVYTHGRGGENSGSPTPMSTREGDGSKADAVADTSIGTGNGINTRCNSVVAVVENGKKTSAAGRRDRSVTVGPGDNSRCQDQDQDQDNAMDTAVSKTHEMRLRSKRPPSRTQRS